MIKFGNDVTGAAMFERKSYGLEITFESPHIYVGFSIDKSAIKVLRRYLDDLGLETTASTSAAIDEGKIPVDNVTKL